MTPKDKQALRQAIRTQLRVLGLSGGGYMAIMWLLGAPIALILISGLLGFFAAHVWRDWQARRQTKAPSASALRKRERDDALKQLGLGPLFEEAEDALAYARRRAGREAGIYPLLDQLLEDVRHIGHTLAAQPERAGLVAMALKRRLPLIGSIARRCFSKDTELDERSVEDAAAVLAQSAAELARLKSALARADKLDFEVEIALLQDVLGPRP